MTIREKRKERKKKKGFTLVELVIVIVIIGVLSGIAVVAFQQVSDAAARATFRANHRTIVSAVIAVYANNDGAAVAKMDEAVSDYLRNAEDETAVGIGALQDAPNGATYIVEPTTGKVTSSLGDETLTYDPTN